MEQIIAKNLTLGYGSKKVVKNVDLTIRKGEFLSIIGPSGRLMLWLLQAPDL